MIKAASHLTDEQVEAFGAELDALRQRVVDDLGERDVEYIRNVIRVQRSTGPACAPFAHRRAAWYLGA